MSDAVSRVRVILNPAAGLVPGERTAQVAAAFARHPGVRVDIEELTRPADLNRAIARALAFGADVIAVGGGDGTLSMAADLLAETPAVLGVLPLGSLNHFARDLRLPLELDEAVDVIVGGRTARVDLGEVNGRYFINNTSIGVYPMAVRLRDRWRHYLGKWPAMLLANLTLLLFLPLLKVRVSLEPGRRSGAVVVVFVGNNRYQLHWPALGQRLRLDSGMLDLMVLREANPWYIMRAIWLVSRGRVKEVRGLETGLRGELVVNSRRRHLRIGIDGETLLMDCPLHYRIRPAALRVRVDPAHWPVERGGAPTAHAGY